MPALNSAMKAGHSAKSQKPADLHRNHLPACSGIGCRHAPEWGAALERIFHHVLETNKIALDTILNQTDAPWLDAPKDSFSYQLKKVSEILSLNNAILAQD